MDGIIFNDLDDFKIPARSAGAYRIASIARQHGFKIKVIDFVTYALDNDPAKLFNAVRNYITPDTKIIGFSTTFLNIDYTHTDRKKKLLYFTKLLNKYFPHVKIIFGGQSANSVKFKELCGDMVHQVHGFGEAAILKFLTNNDNNKFEFDFHNVGPMFHQSDNLQLNEVLPLELSRGCRFACKFCSFPLLGRNPNDLSYIRSYDSIYNELVFNYENFGTTNYYMLCDTFNESTQKLKTIQKAILDLGVSIKFSAYIRLDLLYAFPEQIDILKNMGIQSAFFGIESLNDPSAKAIGKGLGKERTLDTIKRVKEAWPDALLFGSFIVGLPHETQYTANEWCNFLAEGGSFLDSYRIGGLTMHKNSVISSEFERNFEKYGYSFNEDGWFNEHWTSRTAQDFSHGVMENIKDRNKITSWHALGLLNYNMAWSDIINITVDELDQPRFVNLKNEFIKDYFTNHYD